jgi:hypothetical protein
MTLRDTYPLYLNNKAAQPNTDLAVTDKFTGEVAFRTALATPAVIEEAIAGAVRAAEPGWRATRSATCCCTAWRGFRNGSTSWPTRCASRPESRSAIPKAKSGG